jgi:hypothetical protein
MPNGKGFGGREAGKAIDLGSDVGSEPEGLLMSKLDGAGVGKAIVSGGDVGSEPEGLLMSKLGAAGSMAATSAHKRRRAGAECFMAAGAGAFYTENNEIGRINGRKGSLYSEKHYKEGEFAAVLYTYII